MASVPATLVSSVVSEFAHAVVERDSIFSPAAVLSSTSSAVFACMSKACAPPPVGTGGSKGGAGGGRASSGGGGRRAVAGGGPKGGKVKASTETTIDGKKLTPAQKEKTKTVLNAPKKNVAEGGQEVSNLKKAAELMDKGKPVRLAPPAEGKIATLVDELAKRLEGRPKDTINLCLVSVPGTNLFCGGSFDIPRTAMPQLGGKPIAGTKADKLPKDKNGEVDVQNQFVEFLKKNNIGVRDAEMRADQMKASQMQVKADKTHGMAGNPNFDPNERPIMVSRDGYIIDGHHRWSATILRDARDGKLDGMKMKVQVVDIDAKDLLAITNQFTDDYGIEPKSA